MKMDLMKKECRTVDWIHLAEDRDPHWLAHMNHGNEPSRYLKSWEFLEQLDDCCLTNRDSYFSGRAFCLSKAKNMSHFPKIAIRNEIILNFKI
jgi:hypothetical protein